MGTCSQIKLTNGNDLISAFTDSSDESAAPSSFSDSTSRLNNNNNNDWLTDDDDDDEDDVMDESRLNVQPAAKAAAAKAAAAKAAAKPKAAVVPLSTGKLLTCFQLKSISHCFDKCLIGCLSVEISHLFPTKLLTLTFN